jgi:hypothetical protein
MRRPLIAITAAAILGVACSTSLGTSRLAVNPELVNPVVVTSSFASGALGPVNPPAGAPPTPPSEFWNAPSGLLPVLTSPPSEPPEIVMADVDQRMSILYVTDPGAKAILGSSTGMRELPWLFRQEPSNSRGEAALAGGGAQRMWKVSGANLAKQPSGDAMAAMLKAAVDRSCTTPAGVNTCAARMVGVDEIGAAFGTAPGEDDAGTPGARLKAAMISLARKQFRPGESYASRIHFYVAPGVSTSISAGLGLQRTLGRNGVDMRRDYSQAVAAMSRAGGVWLEMYHYPQRGRARTPFTAAEWRDVPSRFAAFLREKSPTDRNPLNYLHFVMTETAGGDEPPGPSCRARAASGAGQNAVPNSVNSDSILDLITIMPVCPPTPPACPTLAPASREMSLLPGPRFRPVVDPNRQQVPNIQKIAGNSIFDTKILGIMNITVITPTASGMTCQWQRAQTGAVNVRILANGPAAFKVTGTEAEVFGKQFRQFFIVG